VKLFVLKNSLPYNRICFTFARGFGNAVERNRSRRLGREAWRHLRPRLLGGYDLILLVYPEAPKKAANGSAVANGSPPVQRAGTCSKSGFAARTEQLALLLSKAGLLR
jgi:hypothetical protein